MYQGFLEGYANHMVQEEEWRNMDKEQAKLEAKELIPYDILYEYFKKCGESEKDTSSAQACLLTNLEKFTLDTLEKMEQGF